MRLATESQATDTSSLRIEKPKPASQHEPHPRSSRRSSEIPEHSALLAEATNDAVRDWSVASGALSWPQGLDTLLGHPRSAVADDIDFWQRQLHADDRARTVASIRDALAGNLDRWSGEYRFRHANGNYLHLLERARIVRNGAGEAVRFVGSLMDITARKQLQDQVVRSQKMEAFGQLAGGVAHDFNNFLTTILGYSDLLLHELGVKGSTAQHINEIRGAAQRASNLTSQLLAFSRKHPLEARVVEVNSIITNLERSLLRLLGENITVECHLHRSAHPAHAKVDPNQLTQIILNLAVNARDAMPQGGRLTLGSGIFRVDGDAHPRGCAERLAPGEYVMISVTDTGAGLSEDAKEHLFEPFFTTKDDGHSSGLGLATSYGIVRQSGGQMCVSSQPGRGTMITIYLPRVVAPPAPSYKKPGSKKMPTGVESILVVEDDVAVRHIAVRILRSLGYDVIEAASGDDAQRLISLDENKKIDLLLTDLVMPLMSGRDFADWMMTTSPSTKVVFISGYLDQSIEARDQGDIGMFFLPKPFDPEQLARKVREALDSACAPSR